ncbi:AAA family ATPase [Sediminitomix flava]|uniref:NadR type nicotinamide-nucleotide adenylyltransferase n=1 Tax=Sediminitomix flava TaxID=379075 RepID=A0A315ZGY4_SEDFL|nr:ATP-binding protein [Sediminitomix flava]PWJ44429.1 NadR type nicotinamide-nucleotide adenylyltransferase [Sediminitomix flava]
MSKTYRIAITGPESSGKSTLAELLAKHYQTVWVPEFARTYIEKLDRPYEEKDLLLIAKGQLAAEEQLIPMANQILFVDTEMTVLKVWGDVKYGRSDAWIVDQLQKQQYDLIFLMKPDLPWEADPQREHPHFRNELFEMYQKELNKLSSNVIIIGGLKEERIEKAINNIELLLNSK